MIQKQKKADSKSTTPAKETAKVKKLPTASKAAPSRGRPRKVKQTLPQSQVLSENEVRQRAYSLWESRGRPIGSPDEDWYRAKDQLTPVESS